MDHSGVGSLPGVLGAISAGRIGAVVSSVYLTAASSLRFPAGSTTTIVRRWVPSAPPRVSV
jgi:hypothetical protein